MPVTQTQTSFTQTVQRSQADENHTNNHQHCTYPPHTSKYYSHTKCHQVAQLMQRDRVMHAHYEVNNQRPYCEPASHSE